MTIELQEPPPHVETQIGRELLDICVVCKYAGMNSKQIQAAILGRTGINASACGNPYKNGVAPI